MWSMKLISAVPWLVSPDGPVIWRMLTYPPTRRALLVGCGLQMFQQVSGMNTVMWVQPIHYEFDSCRGSDEDCCPGTRMSGLWPRLCGLQVRFRSDNGERSDWSFWKQQRCLAQKPQQHWLFRTYIYYIYKRRAKNTAERYSQSIQEVFFLYWFRSLRTPTYYMVCWFDWSKTDWLVECFVFFLTVCALCLLRLRDFVIYPYHWSTCTVCPVTRLYHGWKRESQCVFISLALRVNQNYDDT